jgi:hypothetical protein
MLNISRRDLEHAFAYANSLHSRGQSVAKHGEYVVGTVACQAESGLASFGYGVIEGRYGPVKIGPVSADLLAALLLHGAGFLGVTGKMSGHAHNFAQGLADGYLQRLGIGIGTTMGQKAGKAPHQISGAQHSATIIGTRLRSTIVGAARSRGMSQLTEAEIAALAQAHRSH